MIKLENFIRPNILSLQPYSSARHESKQVQGIFLDANENPYGKYNRYPDPFHQKLKEKISSIKNIPPKNIFIGNGSDEIIDLTFRIFCTPSQDQVILCPPTYGMYEVSAHINDVKILNIPLDPVFQLNVEKILNAPAKILFLSVPNNPTANHFQDIDKIIKHFKGIVFIDEAYIDFSTNNSFINQLPKFPNLIVSQTLSKAWASAAIRIGLAMANQKIIDYYNKVKPPYNISLVNQQEALKTLNKIEIYHKNVQKILSERNWLLTQFSQLKIIEKIYHTDANFILIKVKDANRIYEQLILNSIIIRNRHFQLENCLRITVGKPSENRKLIKALKSITL